MTEAVREQFVRAIEADDRDAIASLLREDNGLRDSLNDIRLKFDTPPLARARSVETARVLLDHGATLEPVAAWWAPGFWVNPRVVPEVGRFLVEQDAAVTPHAASGLGMTDHLAAMIAADPSVVRLRGGDGNTPLAFARTIETAQLLLEHGADINTRDDDHTSTPAQWLIGASPDVARFLVDQGATCDIFLAAALGDRALVEQLIDDDPRCLTNRIGKRTQASSLGFTGPGGPICQWTLGFNSFAHQYAAKKGHEELFQFMFDRSDVTTQFLVACLLARRAEAERIAAAHPGIIDSLDDEDRQLLAIYCWETNVNIDAVRLMLDLGWPIDIPERSHAYSAIHNAAWGGYAELVDLLIERGADVTWRDPDHNSTPLGFALHCCLEDGRHLEGDYTRVVRSLIEAGSPWDPSVYPTGNAKIDAGLAPFLPNGE